MTQQMYGITIRIAIVYQTLETVIATLAIILDMLRRIIIAFISMQSVAET
jgi:hypothetical protein